MNEDGLIVLHGAWWDPAASDRIMRRVEDHLSFIRHCHEQEHEMDYASIQELGGRASLEYLDEVIKGLRQARRSVVKEMKSWD